MEKLIKQKLIDRGFKEETLLNNRGLIGACIEETEQQCDIHVVKCSVCGWSKEKEKECEYCVMQYARNWGL